MDHRRVPMGPESLPGAPNTVGNLGLAHGPKVTRGGEYSTHYSKLSCAQLMLRISAAAIAVINVLVILLLIAVIFFVWKYYRRRQATRSRRATLIPNENQPEMLAKKKKADAKPGVHIVDQSQPVKVTFPHPPSCHSFEHSPHLPTTGVAMDDAWAETFRAVSINDALADAVSLREEGMTGERGQGEKRSDHGKEGEKANTLRKTQRE